ncbi:radical SAM protein [Streptomyces sp. APSN-46.1]|uniref:radical SAM protein n=1 Tax=Streptomyces sp. APSN-46.1 TaxID=2929049 RepID=UPI001FB50C73|nr:radical SAM protein [Streptomyces sp. APSN-46.1]MCJ1677054.1 radical SAM protein [Streptomyces sp. APSN-46.1]
MTAPARTRRPLPLLTPEEAGELRPDLADVIEYRKSGLSLNHVIGCPLECGYCIRHLYKNFGMKVPRALMSDEDAVTALIGHRYFRPHVTPIQLFNKATDPMLPVVKQHTFNTLRLLDEQGLTNHVLVITRWRVDSEDCAILNSFKHIKLSVLVTYSGIAHTGIEPVDSNIAATSLKTLYANADTYRAVFYWRPIVPGLNDTAEHLATAKALSEHAHASVFTGLFFRDDIAAYYRENGLPEPYEGTARRKIMPEQTEARILDVFRRPADSEEPWGPLFRKTSCAVAYAHGLADYNGHYGIRELCDICPKRQLGLCAAAWQAPETADANTVAASLGATAPVEITDRAIITEGLAEQPRYYMQHGYGFQVHDRAHPHRDRRHGRAEIGWRGGEQGAPTP